MGTSDPRSAISVIYWRPVVLIFVAIAITQLGYYIAIAPQLRLLETIFCEQYYKTRKIPFQGSSIPEKLCKVTEIQEAVANLQGWQLCFEAIPGLLLAMPYGAIADNYGRRMVLIASMTGIFLNSVWIVFVCWVGLPLKLIWLSSAFITIGGGSTVATAICMAVIADATPQLQLSRMFFYFQATNIGLALIGPAIGAFLMERSLWLPLLLQVGSNFSAIPICMLVPEMRVSTAKPSDERDERVQPLPESPGSLTPESSSNITSKDKGQSINSLLEHCSRTFKFVIHDRRIMILIIAFFICSFSTQSLSIILQYVSKRYEWSLSRASYVLSFRGGLQLSFYIIVLPAVDAGLARWLAITTGAKDLLLARCSVFIMTLGFALLSFSFRPWLLILGLTFYTLGSGFTTFSRSLLSSLINSDLLGTLYTALSVADTLGVLVAGPGIATAFRIGMRHVGNWLGLPFMLSMCLLGLCYLTLLLVGLSRKEVISGDTDHDGETEPLLQTP